MAVRSNSEEAAIVRKPQEVHCAKCYKMEFAGGISATPRCPSELSFSCACSNLNAATQYFQCLLAQPQIKYILHRIHPISFAGSAPLTFLASCEGALAVIIQPGPECTAVGFMSELLEAIVGLSAAECILRANFKARLAAGRMKLCVPCLCIIQSQFSELA